MTRRPLRVVAIPAATPMPETSVNTLVRMVSNDPHQKRGEFVPASKQRSFIPMRDGQYRRRVCL